MAEGWGGGAILLILAIFFAGVYLLLHSLK
jgi:hypothetical protein